MICVTPLHPCSVMDTTRYLAEAGHGDCCGARTASWATSGDNPRGTHPAATARRCWKSSIWRSSSMRRIEVHAGRAKPRSLSHMLRLFASVVLAAMVAAVPAAAAENPYQRGPDPTRESVAASRGTFATTTVNVPEFRKGVIYYPTDTSQGTFGAIAFVPGYNGSWAALEWTGPWLASFGFVVIGFEATNPGDGDTARGTQLLAALDYLTQHSPVRDRIDPNRTAVIGHSMGGGGAMSAASRRPSLKTAIGLAPAIFSTNMTTMQVPAMLMAGQNDTTVTPSYTKNFYNQIPASTEKAYLELTGAGHGFPSWTPNSAMMRKVVPWFKIFVDNDVRYSQFLCPLMDSTGINAYQSTCPLLPGEPTSARYEAENSPAVCTGAIESNHSGYTGTGFCNGNSAVGAHAQFTVNAATAGTATLRLRFANGTTAARPASLIVNGSTVQTPSFEGTGAWNTWITKTLTVPLNTGSNTIRFSPTTAIGLPNIDHLEVTTA
jgi:pimeloyl-ACP methyl ester carboxylesterase